MLKLGLEVKDKVTGFMGIVTARASYLTGCDKYGVTPIVDSDGRIHNPEWFDEGRLKIIGNGVVGDK